MRVGILGVGDMGSGMAANLLKAGHQVRGYDPKPERMTALGRAGGTPVGSASEAAADVVFVMVMNGDQAADAAQRLRETMAAGSVLVLTCTIRAPEARRVAEIMEGTGVLIIDSPVSGGRPGAEAGTLTLMAAGPDAAFEKAGPALDAISANIHRVGTEVGQGQTVKACLQSLIGCIFTGTYEATVLAAKAGVAADVIENVFRTSAAGCGISNAAVTSVASGTFENTGSRIETMHKDLTIAMDLAREMGVPLFTASTAMQLFQAGRTRHPDGDNQVVALIPEEIVGARLRK